MMRIKLLILNTCMVVVLETELLQTMTNNKKDLLILIWIREE